MAALAALLALVARSDDAGAHPPVPTVAFVTITQDRAINITILHDALAYLLNDTSVRVGDEQMYALLKGPDADIIAACDDAKLRLALCVKVNAGGSLLPIEVVGAPTIESIREWKTDHPDLRLPCKMEARLRTVLPEGALAFTLRFSEVFSDLVVIVDRPGVDSLDFPLAPSETSAEIDVAMLSPAAAPAASGADSGSGPAPAAGPPRAATREPGVVRTLWRYTVFGFRHIIPRGADHALFVLGLFLLSPRLRPTLVQISSFTVAHTITLTLTALHLVGVSSRVVEPVIALSIAFVGIENLFSSKVHAWRPVVAFVFGLAHGMGVATAFSEVGFPAGQLVPSLAAFTVGVEGGHLLVLLLAFSLLGWTRAKPWYRARVAIPLSLAISAVALVWTVQRLLPPTLAGP